jgi:hypothetical protein
VSPDDLGGSRGTLPSERVAKLPRRRVLSALWRPRNNQYAIGFRIWHNKEQIERRRLNKTNPICGGTEVGYRESAVSEGGRT